MKFEIEVYNKWFPNMYNLKHYPTRVSEIFTVEARERFYHKHLTIKQKKLIEENRKYKVRSLFLQNQYIQDSKWDFVGFNTDSNYSQSEEIGKLYCDCGRKLKYQFVLESKNNNKVIKLGISHFMDHLKVPQSVANEIKKGMTEVDLAIDELLWLKKMNYQFPEDLWKRYVISHYRNNTLNEPVNLNRKLAQRVLLFRDAKMPIYISDYAALEQEIRKINNQYYKEDDDTFILDKEIFLNYFNDLKKDIKYEYYDSTIFLNKKISALQRGNRGTINVNEKYFLDFLRVLDKRQSLSLIGKITQAQSFINKGENKKINSEILQSIFKKYDQYGFKSNFFIGIPKVFREGFEKEVNKNQETIMNNESEGKDSLVLQKETQLDSNLHFSEPITNKNNVKLMKEKTLVKEIRASISKLYIQWLLIENDISKEEKEELEELIINDLSRKNEPTKKLDKLFYDKVYLILTLTDEYSENELITMFDNLFQYYSLKDWGIVFSLLSVRENFLLTKSLNESLEKSDCPREYIEELDKRWKLQ